MDQTSTNGSGTASPGRGRGPGFSGYTSLAQGAYYLLTGIWPLVSIGTFQKITGPKTDLWLVKTVGVLVTAIGGVLFTADVRQQRLAELDMLGAWSAASLGGIEAIYAAKGRISPVYFLDALVQLIFILGWLLSRKNPENAEAVGQETAAP